MEINRNYLIVFLTLIYSLGYIGSDIYLPVLPEIASRLTTTIQTTQFSVTSYMLGLAIGQLIYGPLADQYNKKNVLVTGICLFMLSSVIIPFANTISTIIVLRFFSGLGAAAGATIVRVLVYDLFGASDSSKVFSIILPIASMSPAVVPPIGGFIAHFTSWKLIFIFLSLYAAALITSIFYIKFKNINRSSRKENRANVNILKIFFSVTFSYEFLKFALLPGVTIFIYFGYIVETPFIFKHMGLNVSEIGLTYFTFSFGYLFGAQLAKFIEKKYSSAITLSAGYCLFCMGGIIMLACAIIMPLSIFSFIVPMTIITLGNGFVMPISFSNILSSFTNNTGVASSVTGTTQILIATIATYTIGSITNNIPVKLASTICIISILGLIGFVILSLYPSLRKKK